MIRDLLAKDTICAIATPLGIGGIGIIRISGKDALKIAKRIFIPKLPKDSLDSHRLYYGWIKKPETEEIIDEVLLSFMKAPKTYTREDVVEINCHSGYAVLEEILKVVIKEGARLAEPGEFTYRAFLHGRIDLSQAEAVNEIIRSRSQVALKIARKQLEGDTYLKISEWIDLITDLITHLEARIDFEDELEDDDPSFYEHLLANMENYLISPIEEALSSFERTKILREGVSMALIGKPNVGKSSLLNSLLEKERAIVTEHAGTTRDVIEDYFILDGVIVKIMDTAGIRKKVSYIEALGIEKTIKTIEDAHIILWVLDLSENLSKEDDYIYGLIKNKRYCIVLNKADKPNLFDESTVKKRYDEKAPLIKISALKKEDIARLRSFIKETYLKEAIEEVSTGFLINERHKEHLEKALSALYRAKSLLELGSSHEFISFELKDAQKELNAIIGKEISAEEILDRVFSQFCIGK